MIGAGEKRWCVPITAVATVLVLALTVALGALHGVQSGPGFDSGWGTARIIEDNNLASAYPDIAVDGSGNAVAVWSQEDGYRFNIWSNRFVVGVGWGEAQQIETNNSGDAYYAQVSVDGLGNAFAVWYQWEGNIQGPYRVWSNRYDVGSGWETAQLLQTDMTVSAEYPQVAADGFGNAFAMWSQDDGGVWSNRYVVGSGWGTAQLIEPSGSAPQVAFDSSGNAVAVWRHDDWFVGTIWANRYVVGTGWGTAQALEDVGAEFTGSPQVAVDSSGNALAVWYKSSGGGYWELWSSRYVVGTGWEPAQVFGTSDWGDVYDSQIAVDDSGNTVAVWGQYDYDIGRSVIWSNRYVVGSGWGTAQLIQIDTSEYTTYWDVAAGGSGNAVAVWCQGNGSYDSIWSNRYSAESGWGIAQLIETDDSGYALDPHVAMDSSGNAVAVWYQWDGTYYSIWANRYESGEPAIPEFGTVIIPVLSVVAISFTMRGKKKGVCASSRKRP